MPPGLPRLQVLPPPAPHSLSSLDHLTDTAAMSAADDSCSVNWKDRLTPRSVTTEDTGWGLYDRSGASSVAGGMESRTPSIRPSDGSEYAWTPRHWDGDDVSPQDTGSSNASAASSVAVAPSDPEGGEFAGVSVRERVSAIEACAEAAVRCNGTGAEVMKAEMGCGRYLRPPFLQLPPRSSHLCASSVPVSVSSMCGSPPPLPSSPMV